MASEFDRKIKLKEKLIGDEIDLETKQKGEEPFISVLKTFGIGIIIITTIFWLYNEFKADRAIVALEVSGIVILLGGYYWDYRNLLEKKKLQENIFRASSEVDESIRVK
ncbi:MAG: hypothetical protein H6502_01765 [Candidatus Woesearchaeota archaeon]|nr:MAG: hypothetical protein H6502_01765 [Candidatus Woesearchaeota archaeon]